MKKRNLFGSSLGPMLPPMHLVCSNDSLRPAMQCVHIENGIATATDAHSLVRYNLSGFLEDDILRKLDGKLIDRKMWELLTKQPTFFICIENDTLIIKNFNGITGCNVIVPFVNEKYPDFHAVTNDVFSCELLEAKQRICFNAKLFERVAKVLKSYDTLHQYRFWFNQGNKAIVITESSNDDAVAILMPVMWEPPSLEIMNVRKFMKP